MKTTYELLQALCEALGIPAHEASVRSRIAQELAGYEQQVLPLGDLLVTLRKAWAGEKTLLFEAHADRIGLLVCGFLKDGFLRVAKAGGMDPSVLMGSELLLESKDGTYLPGIVGGPFPYPAKPHNSVPDSERKMPKLDELLVDTGFAHPEEVFRIGAPVYMKAKAYPLAGSRIAAPALDNRAACAALILAARLLEKEQLHAGVQLLFSSREEVGGAGARTGAFAVQPDVCVTVDAGFALAPDVTDKDASEMGKGPEIDIAALLDAATTDALIAAAKENDIPCQLLVLPGRSTGTDADVITVSGAGICTGLVSIPVRFMHQPAETADLGDVENTAKLLAAFAKGMK